MSGHFRNPNKHPLLSWRHDGHIQFFSRFMIPEVLLKDRNSPNKRNVSPAAASESNGSLHAPLIDRSRDVHRPYWGLYSVSNDQNPENSSQRRLVWPDIRSWLGSTNESVIVRGEVYVLIWPEFDLTSVTRGRN